MKNIISFFLLFWIIWLNFSSAYEKKEKLAADFLAYKDVILLQENANNYRLNNYISRKEMAKVTINLSGENIMNVCSGIFSDVKSSDWGCKYIEMWVNKWFFSKNSVFRPSSNISKAEALKMIMKARNVEKDSTISNWQEAYVKSALKAWLIEKEFSDYDSLATRWWIFQIAQNAIQYSEDQDIKLIENLLNM